ncbi:universal stress protein [bacterium]|nr:universal stress protein [bacterium]
MSKRIVVGLDGSTYSNAAISAALSRAAACGGTVIGVAVIDLPGIESAETGAGLGSIYYSRKIIEEHLASATARTKEFLSDFAQACQAAGVPYEIAHEIGVPFRALLEYAKTADLIVVGVRTFFHFETQSEPGDTVLRLVKHPITPVLAVTENWTPRQTALVNYQGDKYSGRALSALLHLHNLSPIVSKVVLVTVDMESELSKQRLELAARYVQAYGLPVDIARREGEMASVLKNETQHYPDPLIVIGSVREGWLADFLSHSATEKLLEFGSVPLLVYQ